MTDPLVTELKHYIGFGPSDGVALRALLPFVRPRFGEICEAFCERLSEHAGAPVGEQGAHAAELATSRETFRSWLEHVLTGPWDGAFFELPAALGRAHVKVGLPQHDLLAAMNGVRLALDALVDNALESAAERSGARTALARVLDLALAVMLDSYRQDLLQQQARSARLSTFGQLAGSVAHELRNPLGVIQTSLYVLQRRVPEDPRVRQQLDRIGEQVAIANGIVDGMLDLIRDRPLRRAPVSLGELVGSVVDAAPRSAGVRVILEGLEGAQVYGDAVQLRQVFANLVQNAIQAVDGQGEVRVCRLPSDVDGLFCVERLAFEDDGPGVDPRFLSRLFEPLATTKERGNGLGLALVKRIVERHGGSVRYEPRPGGGARFCVELPADHAAA